MKSKLVVYVALGLVLCVTLAVVALARSSKKRPRVSKTETVGTFAILTHEIRYLSGWNQGPLKRATTEVYSIAHRGQPFRFVGKGGLFVDKEQEYEMVNSAITFPSPEPAFVVNVGDPNNRSFFYLIREVDGKPQPQLLGEASGEVAADWIDPTNAPPAGERRRVGVHRAHMEGGRYLLLSSSTVLDTARLVSFTLDTPPAFLYNELGPLAMSPDSRSFIRLGSEDGILHVVVFEIETGRAYSHPVDRSTMRYNEFGSIDAAWINHHFEWQAQDGSQQLAARGDFVPLPRSGTLTHEARDGFRQYRIQPVKAEMQQAVVTFLTGELKGVLLPRAEFSPADDVAIDGRTVNVMFSDTHVGLWMDRGTDSSLMIEVAAALDRALAEGQFDGFFVQ